MNGGAGRDAHARGLKYDLAAAQQRTLPPYGTGHGLSRRGELAGHCSWSGMRLAWLWNRLNGAARAGSLMVPKTAAQSFPARACVGGPGCSARQTAHSLAQT